MATRLATSMAATTSVVKTNKGLTKKVSAEKPQNFGRSSKGKGGLHQLPRLRRDLVLPATKPMHAVESELREHLHILDRIYHRNRNQHGNQHWWRALGLLRKYVRVLCGIEDEMSTLKAKTSKEGKAEDVRKGLERMRRLEEWKIEVGNWTRDVLIERCYRAFSSVLGDTQFAGLGVVLVGVLAGVGAVVGLPEVNAEVEVESFVGISRVRTGKGVGGVEERLYAREDVGEVVERDDMHEQEDVFEGFDSDGLVDANVRMEDLPEIQLEPDSESMSGLVEGVQQVEGDGGASTTASNATIAGRSRSRGSKVSKRKKGKGNAIDDLFGGLV